MRSQPLDTLCSHARVAVELCAGCAIIVLLNIKQANALHLLVPRTSVDLTQHSLHLLRTSVDLTQHPVHLLCTSVDLTQHLLHLLCTSVDLAQHSLHLLRTNVDLTQHPLHLRTPVWILRSTQCTCVHQCGSYAALTALAVHQCGSNAAPTALARTSVDLMQHSAGIYMLWQNLGQSKNGNGSACLQML